MPLHPIKSTNTCKNSAEIKKKDFDFLLNELICQFFCGLFGCLLVKLQKRLADKETSPGLS